MTIPIENIEELVESEPLLITEPKGVIAGNYYYLELTHKSNRYNYKIIFDKGVRADILQKETEGKKNKDEAKYYIKLNKLQQQKLGIETSIIECDMLIGDLLHIKKEKNIKLIQKHEYLRAQIYRHGVKIDTVLEQITKESTTTGIYELKDKYNLDKNPYALEEIYDEFIQIISKIYYHDQVIYDILFVWLIQDVLTVRIQNMFLLHIHGVPGSGKSKLMELLELLCPYACFAGRSTLAFDQRIINKYGCALLLDEFEKFNPAKRLEFCQMINCSTSKSSSLYGVANLNKEDDDTDIIQTFCSKFIAANSLEGLEDSTVSRMFMITSYQDSIKKIPISIAELEEDWRDDENSQKLLIKILQLQKKIQYITLFNCRQITKSIKQLKEDTGFKGRDAFKAAVVAGVLKLCKEPEKYERRKKRILKYIVKTKHQESLPQNVVIALDYILQQFLATPLAPVIKYGYKALDEYRKTYNYAQDPFGEFNTKKVRADMEIWKLISHHKRTSGYIYWFLTREKFMESLIHHPTILDYVKNYIQTLHSIEQVKLKQFDLTEEQRQKWHAKIMEMKKQEFYKKIEETCIDNDIILTDGEDEEINTELITETNVN